MKKSGFLSAGFLCRTGVALLVIVSSPAWSGNLKGQVFPVPGIENYQLLVKFRASTGPDLDSNGRMLFRGLAPVTRTSAQRNALALRYRRTVNFTPEELHRIRSGAAALAKPSASGYFDILQFSGLMYVDAPNLDKNALAALGQQLETLDEVEYCSLEPVQGAPPPDPFDVPNQANHDAAPVTPLYTSQQGWLGANPGVDCRYGWTAGADGYGVTVRDIEDSWGSLKHEDFPWDSLAYVLPAFNHTYDDHGMGIFGMIFGQHNGYGIDGCAPRAKGRAYSFQTSASQQNRPNAMTRMVSDAVAGDVILLEMQTSGADGNLAPADYTTSIWDLTKQATDKGVVVVGTAGNGGANLDASAYAAYRARGDNGVVMEGAGTSTTAHTKLSFSSFGRCCVHVQGWGQNVVTTGYTTLANLSSDSTQRYTNSFSGTSSGGGMMAGVVAAIQSYAKKNLGRTLTSLQMRNLLISTGIPQGADSLTAHIGPLPNIRAAIASLGIAAGVNGVQGIRDVRWRLERNAILADVPAGKRFDLSLTDVSGRVVYKANGVISPKTRWRIPVPELTRGVYFLSIRNERVTYVEKHALLP